MMDLESESTMTYEEMRSRAREAHERIKHFSTFEASRWLAEPAEEHSIKLERGFYRNEPEYLEDGDFYLASDTSDTGGDFWDFL